MRRSLAALPLALLALAAQAKTVASEVEAVFSPQYAACIDASGGVTANLRDCASAEDKRLDLLLNREYQAALARMPNKAARTKLRRSERDWLRTRYDHCAKQAEAEEGGTLWLIVMDQCGLDAVASRIVWLRHYKG